MFPDGGPEVLAAVAAQGLPAVIAKRADSPYRRDPGPDWVLVTTAARAGSRRAGVPAPDRAPLPRASGGRS